MGKNGQFQKFIDQKSNAAKKEAFRQEKKAAKKERAAAIDKRFEEKRKQKLEAANAATKDGPVLRITKADLRAPKTAPVKPAATVKPAAPVKPAVTVKAPEAPAGKAPAIPVVTPAKGPKIRIPKPGSLEEKIQRQQLAAGIQPAKPAAAKPGAPATQGSKPTAYDSKGPAAAKTAGAASDDADLMPLNKFIAHSGVCSRRDAAELVKRGEVRVNDQVITEPGTKVSPRDTVTIKGKKLTPSRNHVYVLLNKPKDYITTLDDPEGRKTVLDLVKRATDERIYPVGRLDRNTSGVLLLTNDGELAQTLSHPKHEIKKIYEVRLDRPLTKADFEQLTHGLTLEDGFIVADAVGYVDPKDKSVIGIEIHSGRNRIVRRMFEFLRYDVKGLDRVMYAGLTKKNVQRGQWRLLTEKEIRILKHFNPQTKTAAKAKAAPKTKGPHSPKPSPKAGPKTSR